MGETSPPFFMEYVFLFLLVAFLLCDTGICAKSYSLKTMTYQGMEGENIRPVGLLGQALAETELNSHPDGYR